MSEEKTMSNLEAHAREELARAGLLGEGSDYDGMLGEALLRMICLFEDEGHSGMSAAMALQAFEKLARLEPLTPLTGADDEWIDVDGGNLFQNCRCSRVFKDASGKAYDSERRVFREPDGFSYISRDSRVEITFPYVPTRTYVDVESAP